jgi:hypothetical protein
MSEITPGNANVLNSFRTRVAILAAAGAIAVGNLFNPAAAQADNTPLHGGPDIPMTVDTVPDQAAPEVLDGAENGPIPPEIQAVMRRDTVRIPKLGCSGFIIRDNQEQAVAVITAEHCSLRDNAPPPYISTPRYTGSDGKRYMVQTEPVIAETGDDVNNMQTAAEIDSFILPKSGDTSHDVAIGVVKGQDPMRAMKFVRQAFYTPLELGQRPLTRPVYASAYPQFTYKNSVQLTRQREAFVTTLTSGGYTSTVTGESFPVQWIDIQPTDDGGSGTPGSSGAAGFELDNGRVRIDGVFGAYCILQDGQPVVIQNPEATPEGVATRDGLAFQLTPPGKGGEIVKVVRSYAEIPGFINPEVAIDRARVALNDSKQPKTVIKGLVGIPSPKDVDMNAYSYIRDPLLVRDARHGVNILAAADPNTPDSTSYIYLRDEDLGKLAIFADRGHAKPGLTKLSGRLAYQSDPTGRTNGGFRIGKHPSVGNLEFNQVPLKGDPLFLASAKRGQQITFTKWVSPSGPKG